MPYKKGGYRRARKRYTRRRAQQRRARFKRRGRTRKGLSRTQRRQAQTIAQIAVMKLSKPKRMALELGQFNTDALGYCYGTPKIHARDPLTHQITGLGGLPCTCQTTSVPVGQLAQGGALSERAGYRTLIRGFSYDFIVSHNPLVTNQVNVVSIALVSTMNDPAGGNLSYIAGQPQNALYHIPSLLLPPKPQMGYRYKDDSNNRIRQDLDPKEYKIHWRKKVYCWPNTGKMYANKKLKIKVMFKRPIRQLYAAAGAGSLTGRKFYLLFNSSADALYTSAVAQTCPCLHARIWTYFRDMDE